jgi:hypothetical protein
LFELRVSFGSDDLGQLGECDSESTTGRLVGGNLVVSAAQVLNEGVTGGKDS